MPVVQRAAYQRNFDACRYGTYGCNMGQVSAQDVPVVQNNATGSISEPQPTFVYNSPPVAPVAAGCAENGSCYGDISSATGRARTVAVSGYYRSDGTYVRGHYRSPPRR